MRRILLLILVFPTVVYSLPIEPDAVFVRVVDSGAGLATVVRMPGDRYMIYDAGHWTGEGGTDKLIFRLVLFPCMHDLCGRHTFPRRKGPLSEKSIVFGRYQMPPQIE